MALGRDAGTTRRGGPAAVAGRVGGGDGTEAPHAPRPPVSRNAATADPAAAERLSPRTPLPHVASFATRVAIRVVLLLFGPWVRLEGGHRLDRLPEPAIFAFNHNNSIESVVVPAVLIARRRGRMVRFAVDWMFLHLPLVGWVLRRVDPIPVYTKPFRWRLFEGYRQAHRHRSPVEGCRRALEEGGSVGLFPEGTRNGDARRLARGRSGLGHLVLDGPPVPVVPVGIDYPAKARLGRVPRVGRTVVRVGEPLDFSAECAAAAAPETSGADRRRMARAVVDRVMVELAVLGGKEPPPRSSDPFPSAATFPADDGAPTARPVGSIPPSVEAT